MVLIVVVVVFVVVLNHNKTSLSRSQLVSNHSIKDVSASMKPGSTPGSPLPYDLISKTAVSGDANPSRGYRNHRKPMNPPNQYVPLGSPEPSQVSYLSPVGMAEPLLSVGCSTEDDWEEPMGFKPPALNPRGMRRSHRGAGGRGRGGYDQGRGANRRRDGGEPGVGPNYVQFNRGRGRERRY